MNMDKKVKILSFILVCSTIQPVLAELSPAQKMVLRIQECFLEQVNVTGTDIAQNIAACFSVASSEELDALTSSVGTIVQERQTVVMALAPFANVLLWFCYIAVLFRMDHKGYLNTDEEQ